MAIPAEETEILPRPLQGWSVWGVFSLLTTGESALRSIRAAVPWQHLKLIDNNARSAQKCQQEAIALCAPSRGCWSWHQTWREGRRARKISLIICTRQRSGNSTGVRLVRR